MYNFDNGNFPKDLINLFVSATKHNYNTRFSKKSKLKIPKKCTVKFGQKSFSVTGAKILNTIKESDIYKTSTTYFQFKKKVEKYDF